MKKMHAIFLSSLMFASSAIALAKDKTSPAATAAPGESAVTRPTHAEHEATEDAIKANAKAAEAACKK